MAIFCTGAVITCTAEPGSGISLQAQIWHEKNTFEDPSREVG